jgi:hypothetical protein
MTFLGLKNFSRELCGVKLQLLFIYSRATRAVIDARYGVASARWMALHRGFLRLSKRPTNMCEWFRPKFGLT